MLSGARTRIHQHALAGFNVMCPAKTHQTAVVVIPPPELWEPIQAIRRRHDRQVRRWMPHITLIYPFVPAEAFAAIEPELAAACSRIEPFELCLREFAWFAHGRESFTVWLSPEPAECLRHLHAALLRVVPHCDDTARHPQGFTPHLSVGQVRGRRRLEGLISTVQATWQALSFRVKQISLIWRNRPPDDVFRVGVTIPLGSNPRPGRPL
jgi:2'-5' RNA ligase